MRTPPSVALSAGGHGQEEVDVFAHTIDPEGIDSIEVVAGSEHGADAVETAHAMSDIAIIRAEDVSERPGSQSAPGEMFEHPSAERVSQELEQPVGHQDFLVGNGEESGDRRKAVHI